MPFAAAIILVIGSGIAITLISAQHHAATIRTVMWT
jgi:hypothetical protein